MKAKPHIKLHMASDLQYYAAVYRDGKLQYHTNSWYAVPHVLTDVLICERIVERCARI